MTVIIVKKTGYIKPTYMKYIIVNHVKPHSFLIYSTYYIYSEMAGLHLLLYRYTLFY